MNKYQTALNALRKLENPDYYYCGESNCDALQKLVDKEKPMKPNNDNCPNCGKHLGIDGVTIKSEYCPHCGQRIDWGNKK